MTTRKATASAAAASGAGGQLAKKRRLIQRRDEGKIQLERVLGLTCTSGNALSVASSTSCVVYPAGCTVVLHYLRINKFTHIINPSRKPVTCVCLSSDSKFVAFGECGHTPCIQVWDISCTPPTHVISLQGHSFGVTCLCFSPNVRYLISVGYQHDQNIHIWNWRAGVKIASNKITSKRVYGIAFSEDGSYFVTAGSRRVRFWYFDTSQKIKTKLTLPLNGRSAILGEHQNNCFVAVKCGSGQLAGLTYALTKSGLLCQFSKSRQLEKFVDVKSGQAYCLECCQQYIICGCIDGIVRLFDPASLDYIATMPRPHPLSVQLSNSLHSTQYLTESGKCPDTIALGYDSVNNKLVVIYNDHSLYVWDMRSIEAIGKTHSFLYHNACVWDINVYPPHETEQIPALSFATCSSDNTIRLWNIQQSGNGSHLKNVYSKEIFHILYTDADSSYLRDVSQAPGDASAIADTTRGVRSVQFSPQGNHLAVGDRQGNLRVYDLQFMDKIVDVMAHDAEILSLKYSPQNENFPMLLATGSRDRLIHIFSVANGYSHLHTIDDHSASITAVDFSIHQDCLYLYSSGADKSLIYHTLDKRGTFKRSNHIVEKSSMYDMIVDPTGRFIATVGQDKLLRVYNVGTGKLRVSYKGCDDEGTTGLLKLALDPSGTFVAVSATDKIVYIFNFLSGGECLSRLQGHSEVVTALSFSVDCQHLFTTSGDSCIFVWRLQTDLTEIIRRRLIENNQNDFLNYCAPVSSTSATPTPATPISSINISERRGTYTIATGAVAAGATDQTDDYENSAAGEEAGFRFSVSKLPAWAQKHVYSRPSVAATVGVATVEGIDLQQQQQQVPIAGKWAERLSPEQCIMIEEVEDSSEGGSVSDSELDELLTLELNKALSRDQVIEGLREEETVTDTGAVEDAGDREEEELVYPEPVNRESIDPSMFKVNTPERRLSLPDENSLTVLEEEDSPDSSCSTPESLQKTLTDLVDDTAFLRTHFESLTAEKADALFTSPTELPDTDHRPSISTQYFNRRRSYTTGCITRVRPLIVPPHSGSPDLITSSAPSNEATPIKTTPPADVVSPIVHFDMSLDSLREEKSLDDESGSHDSHVTRPDVSSSDKSTSCDSHVTEDTSSDEKPNDCHVTKEEANDDKSHDSHMTGGSIIRFRPRIKDSKVPRPKITKEEISLARKRLEELGYSEYGAQQSKESSDDISTSNIEDTTPAVVEPLATANDQVGGAGMFTEMGVSNEVGVPDGVGVSNEAANDFCCQVKDVEQKFEESFSQLRHLIDQAATQLSLSDHTHFKELVSQTIKKLSTKISELDSAHNLSSHSSTDQSSVAVATVNSSFLSPGDVQMQSLLEFYSERLVEIVQEKLKND